MPRSTLPPPGGDRSQRHPRILAQHIIIGTGLSVVTWFALRKAKAGNAGSKLVHAAYWYLPGSFLGLKATPPSHCRLLAG